jgi:hypothetical protein
MSSRVRSSSGSKTASTARGWRRRDANVLTQQANLDNSDQAQRSKEVNTLAQDAAIANAQGAALQGPGQTFGGPTPSFPMGGSRPPSATSKSPPFAPRKLSSGRPMRRGRSGPRTSARRRWQARPFSKRRSGKGASPVSPSRSGHTVIRAPQAGQLSEVSVRRGST